MFIAYLLLLVGITGMILGVEMGLVLVTTLAGGVLVAAVKWAYEMGRMHEARHHED